MVLYRSSASDRVEPFRRRLKPPQQQYHFASTDNSPSNNPLDLHRPQQSEHNHRAICPSYYLPTDSNWQIYPILEN